MSAGRIPPRRGDAPRLLMTADAVGGVWTYALELARELLARRFEVVLAVLGPALRPDQRAEAVAVAGLEVIETGLPLDWTAGSPAEVRAAGERLADLARRVGAELIHLNSPALAAGAPFEVPVVGACHSCVATWWTAVVGGEMPGDFRWRTRLLAEGYAACDDLVAPSRAFADATEAAYGARPRTVRNGRTAPPPAPSGPRTPTALAAGRLWDRGKGAAILDAAAALTGVRIEAAGPLQDAHSGEATSLNSAVALGRLDADELRRKLQEVRVFASPALYEPFGLSVLEAAQAGCSLVLSDIPTFRELWDGAAVFVSPGDAQALARALDSLVPDEAACADLGARARRRAEAYTPSRMADGMVEVYHAVLDRVPAEAVA